MSNPTTVSEPLPRREDADRCAAMDGDRRCVLPPEHDGDHVYPPTPGEDAPPP